MPSTLLATKFHVPVRQSKDISRQSLLDKLQAGLHENRKLTLVSAPAGYGKTTLLADWVHSITSEHRVSWLSLDEGDNECTRFLQHWVSIFERLDPNLGQEAQPILKVSQPSPYAAIMDVLINKLVMLEIPALVVLDDYHIITNPEVHESLEYFIEHQPPLVHLAILTREDPPLPLARMRTRRQLTEIRAQHLRFTLEEAQQFFRESMQLKLNIDEVRQLEERTEGWIAGLQLAAMALQNLPNPQDFIRTFSGSHRYILDYLAEEVLRQQDEEIREFLLKTVILEKFNASVCNAVTQRSDSSLFLLRLEQANLFLIPLDNDRVWYRYHHLFADYLRTTLDAADQAVLHEKASHWHEKNGLVFEAIRHAFLSGKDALAADVLERAIQNTSAWTEGDIATLLAWIDKLSPALLQSRPVLTLHASRAFYLAGLATRSQQFLDQAERSLRENPGSVPDVDRLLAIAALYRGSLAAFRGNVQVALDRATYALDQLSADDLHARARAMDALGLAYELSGQLDKAIPAFLQSSDLANSAGVSYLAVIARCEAAQAQITQGRLDLATRTCHDAIAFVDEAPIPPLGLAYSVLGEIARERNDLANAEELLLKGMKLSRQGGLMDDLRCELVMLARLKQAAGDWTAAMTAIDQADSITRSFEIPRLSVLSGAHRARIQLAQGINDAAQHWAEQYENLRGNGDVEYIREFEDLTLARVFLKDHALDKAQCLLTCLYEEAETAGRVHTSIEAMMLLSLVYHAQKKINASTEHLEMALKRAEAQGFLRIFLDEGLALKNLLPKVRNAVPDFVDQLLRELSSPATVADHTDLHTASGDLIAPLSAQERRVLGLIGAGKSNQEIADELVISSGTAKWHVHNILQKLGVNSRSQAILRARQLGLS